MTSTPADHKSRLPAATASSGVRVASRFRAPLTFKCADVNGRAKGKPDPILPVS